MINMIYLSLSFFCFVVIVQESTGQTLDSQWSFLSNLYCLWLACIVAIFRKRIIPAEGTFFVSIIKLFLIVLVAQTVIPLYENPDFMGPFLWNIVKLFNPLLSAVLLAMILRNSSIEDLNKGIDLILYASIIAMIPKILMAGISEAFSINNILIGKFGTESDTLCVVFGILAIYYLLNQKKRYSLIALFFVLLTGKRIVFLAILFILLMQLPLIKRVVSAHKTVVLFSLVLLNLLFAYLIYAIGINGDVINLIIANFTDDVSSLTSGRYTLYERLIDRMGDPGIIGTGMGSVIYTLRSISSTEEWLHSDVLMNLYEMGFVGFVIWIFYLYRKMLGSYFTFSLMLFMNIIYITDNVFYYFAPNMVFYFAILISVKIELGKQQLINNS